MSPYTGNVLCRVTAALVSVLLTLQLQDWLWCVLQSYKDTSLLGNENKASLAEMKSNATRASRPAPDLETTNHILVSPWVSDTPWNMCFSGKTYLFTRRYLLIKVRHSFIFAPVEINLSPTSLSLLIISLTLLRDPPPRLSFKLHMTLWRNI